jgi:hypothetical protein
MKDFHIMKMSILFLFVLGGASCSTTAVEQLDKSALVPWNPQIQINMDPDTSQQKLDPPYPLELGSAEFPFVVSLTGRLPKDAIHEDLNGDGFLDLLSYFPLHQFSTQLFWIPGGKQGFSAPRPIELANITEGWLASIQTLHLGDMDQDGDIDLLVAKNQQTVLLENSGSEPLFFHPGRY